MKNNDDDVGLVLDHEVENGAARARVQWIETGKTRWEPIERLDCGFKRGMDVCDVPRSRVRRSLGEGVVLALRRIGGRAQVLVEFTETGLRRWIPYENLRWIKGVRHRFLQPGEKHSDSPERFRLRCLSYAIELWNENTGALSHFDIDPLPHQIHLVHHILASGNLNWLIADDVGLGKTIEVGMLLSALQQRDMFRRILLVTPAGLTRQWKDELHSKFAMSDFLIYGDDFIVREPRQWRMFNHVIASVDRLKGEEHLDVLLQGDRWDLVVFDEAHRLSRRQFGRKYEASDRFHLAAELRKMTDSVLLLTATPHQGMQDKFQALLELLRPELKKQITRLELEPGILKDMVIRNYKADVTDNEGQFIFQGKTSRAIRVPVSDESKEFDRALQSYLRRGYAAGRRVGGVKGRAIGFVMTVYRKLAASSVAAIHMALVRRRERLLHEDWADEHDEIPDERFEGEWEEEHVGGEADEFFTGEIDALEGLIGKVAALYQNDLKKQKFLDELVGGVLCTSPNEKILVFTEYRATQTYLQEALEQRFGEGSVELIHGGMTSDERGHAIARFEDQAQFLVSTEAGGEGINLQHECHVMVNFDLPWNPMRIVQRIGRLYRYGQRRRVVVFNIHAPQTLDASIMETMYMRLDQVVRDMATVGDEFKPGLEAEILGEVADLMDVEEILEEAASAGIERTRERIDEALDRARKAAAKQRELFAFAKGFDPDELKRELAITPEHLHSFVESMFEGLGIEVMDTRFKGVVMDIRLPDALENELPGLRKRIAVTLDRTFGSRRPDIHTLDLDSSLMQFMLKAARQYEYGGKTALVSGLEGNSALVGILRWQNDQGRRMRRELISVLVDEEGDSKSNPGSFSEWLATPASEAPSNGRFPPDTLVKACYKASIVQVDARLAELSNNDLHPEGLQWVAGAWRLYKHPIS